VTKRAVDYTRLSGGDSETSIDRQHEANLNYIDERDDLEHVEWYNEGKRASGWDEGREEYQRLLTDAANDEFDVVVVRNGSRIGRDKVERLDTFTDLANKHDVEFHTTNRGYVDPANPTDLLMEVFSATKDDEGKREEIKNAVEEIERRVADSETYHGRPPFGLQFADDGRTLEPDSEEWPALREALRLRFVKDEMLTSIEDEAGVTTSTLSRTLNERLGLLVDHVDDPELLNAIQDELDEEKE